MEAEKWGRRIRAFRKLKGYTQEGLAKELGLSVSAIGEVERGNRMPTKELIEQIACLLNIPVHELKPEEEESKDSANIS